MRHTQPELSIALVLALAFAATGCTRWLSAAGGSDGGPSPTASSTAEGGAGHVLTPLWSDRELHFAELPTARVRFDVDDTTYEMRFKDFPAGTVVVAGGRTTSIGGDYTERIDVAEAIARLSPVSALDDTAPLDPHADVELRVPTFDSVKATAPAVRVAHQIAIVMGKAIDHSVLFPRETATDPALAVHTILFVPNSSIGATAFGPAATMRDVDWIAVAEALPARKGGSCSVPPSGTSGTPKPVKLQLVDEEVVIVERKTSRVVSRRTFAAVTDCPTYASEAVEETAPDPAAIKRWLRDERNKP